MEYLIEIILAYRIRERLFEFAKMAYTHNIGTNIALVVKVYDIGSMIQILGKKAKIIGKITET
ncbi:hypothetical protein AwErysi_08370 [Erysipelotrichaceae bacterium]|nr:hypothetical protein AwErysi_08370 [Erysipelotrichaceae bacterium]